MFSSFIDHSQTITQSAMELENVTPSEIIFSKKLFASDFSVVFLVTVRNQECVMKVVSRPANVTLRYRIIDFRSTTEEVRGGTMSVKTVNWTFTCSKVLLTPV